MASLFIFGVENTSSPRSLAVQDPAVAGFGAEVIVKDMSGGASSHNITITPDAGLIDGAATYVIDSNYGVVHMKSDGREWIVIATKGSGAAPALTAPYSLVPSQTLDARLATVADLPTHTASGGPGVGFTLTASGNGALQVDSTDVAVNDVILYKSGGNSTLQKQHGLYDVIATGDGSNPWILRRSTNFDQSSEVMVGTVVPVSEGNINGGVNFVTTLTSAPTFGSDRILWVQTTDPPNIVLNTFTSRFPVDVVVGRTLTVQSELDCQSCSIGGVVIVGTNGFLGEFGNEGSGQGAAIANATDAPSAITQLNLLLAYFRTRGSIAT